MSSKKPLTPEQHHARETLRRLVYEAGGDRCLSCGACVDGCPIADWNDERLDPRRLVRLVQNGVGETVADQDWIWHCTNCGRCSWNCPVGIDLSMIIATARGLVPRGDSPGNIQKTADLHRAVHNNMQISPEDWIDTVEWMAEELEGELGEKVEIPFDKQDAELVVTINSKLPQYYPMDLQNVFKIFRAAGVSWSLPRDWWEGTNYAMFTNDLDTWEYTLRQQVEKVEQLRGKVLAYTECGHGYFATLSGYERFGIEPGFEVIHVVNLYAKWIREGRFKLDPSRNPGSFTLHDPCNAVRKAAMAGYPSIAHDARYVMEHVVQSYVEMTPNREQNYCCSGGGGALLAGFKHARNHYGRSKVDQVDRCEAQFVCTPCVNCFDGIGNLASEYDRPWRPIHMWKLLARAIVLDE